MPSEAQNYCECLKRYIDMKTKNTQSSTGNRSETVTEGIFREFYGLGAFIEKSAIPSHYGFKSKRGTGYKGYPDFFRDNKEEDFVVVVEAKANDFKLANEEVLWYATMNNIDKDIVAISISGQSEKSYKSNTYILIGGRECKVIETDDKLLPLKSIVEVYRKEKYGEYISTSSLKSTINHLNKDFQKKGIKDAERSLFFAGLMIALKDGTFARTYKNIEEPTKEERESATYKLIDAHNLNNAILDAIVRQISNKINNLSKEYNWKDRFSFIKNIDIQLYEYKEIIDKIEKKIFHPFRMDEKQDILGRAYKIFLSKAGKIDNKNIILTPDHIKSLMVDLARLDVKDVVIDTCTGSGGFLMEAMEVLIDKAKNSTATIDRIKEEQLIGFETDPTLFALACSNMFLHGDGRTNLIFGSSLVEEDDSVFVSIKEMKPNKCIINPPYENNLPILFVQKAIDFLEPNGKLVIIMPTPTLNRNIGGATEQILKIAKLDFVIKMPNNLFSEQGRTVNTSIFGFTKTPHEKSDKVIFYNMDDDGFVSVQHKGRIDKYGKWKAIRDNIIARIKHNSEVEAEYVLRSIYDGDILNCYGIKSRETGGNLVKIGMLFKKEKGTLQSDNCIDGEYNFITASEEWKRHYTFDHDCEALVYAVAAGGSLGRSHYVSGKFIASNLCLVLTSKNNEEYPVDLQFYNMYFNKIRKKIVNELADGTSKLTINAEELMNYYIEYFPIEVQKEMVKYYNENVMPAKKHLIEVEKEMSNKIELLLL